MHFSLGLDLNLVCETGGKSPEERTSMTVYPSNEIRIYMTLHSATFC